MCVDDAIRYSILDPTGNITALVESPVAVAEQPAVAAEVMGRHSEVEQVGFVRSTRKGSEAARTSLRMAGGEFCGNATMSAAALHFLRACPHGAPAGDVDGLQTVWVDASGAADAVEVRLRRAGDWAFDADVHMPRALEVRSVELCHAGLAGRATLVAMEGISHLVIGPDSPLSRLRQDRATAEAAVRAWCAELRVDGLGLMFLDGALPALRLTPLVYVPGGDTTFWENSCASGSAAVGSYLAYCADAPVDVELAEPGGTLRVRSNPATGDTWLSGHVRLVTSDALQ